MPFRLAETTTSTTHKLLLEPISCVLGSKELQKHKMVKFSKQFEAQVVPEWKEAFVDYKQLKKDLKKIHLLNNDTKNITPNKKKYLFSSLRNYSLFRHHHQRDHHHGPIQVLHFSIIK